MNIHERIDKWHVDAGVELFRQMHLPKDAIFLDFGCGYGEYAIALALANTSSTVYAIDKNKKILKIIQDKIEKYDITNIQLCEANGSLIIDFPNNFANMVLMYDFIHGNTQEKLPIRFTLFDEAKRVLKPNGILSIAPFECANLRDSTGKSRRYTHEMLIDEIEACGFQFNQRVEGAIHFDYYHSSYHWKKLNGNMAFDYLEEGYVLNFLNIKAS